MTDRWLCTVCDEVTDHRHEHDGQASVPLLHSADRASLEDARERLEGVHRRTQQAETRRALEDVQRVLERDDRPARLVALNTRPVHHHRPLVQEVGRAWGGL